MWRHVRLAAALAAIGSVSPLAAQEQVSIDLPSSIVIDGAVIAGASEPSRPVAVRFSQALLAPGRSLRIGVRAEDGEPGSWLSFVTKNARGGAGRSGRVGTDLFVPVFESFPWASSGGFEMMWILEPSRDNRHAGRRAVTLRWQIESIPVPDWMQRERVTGGGLGASPRSGDPSTGEPASRFVRPGTSVWEKPDRKDRRRPPAQEVP